MPTLFSQPTANGGFRNCDCRCHYAVGNRCTCICGGALHGFARRSDKEKRDVIAAFPERFTGLSDHQVAILDKLLPYPQVYEPKDDLLQLPLEVKP